MATIAELPNEPKYTIKTVCSETGIRPVTLRAWERRYGLLQPHRSENQYRSYSDQDLALLRWIKTRVESGLTISAAVRELHEMQQSGRLPEISLPAPLINTKTPHRPAAQVSSELYDLLVQHNENAAVARLQEAQSMYNLNTFCLQVIVPCLVAIGDAWERGEIRIATEHFASSFLRGRLMAMFQVYPLRKQAPSILVGCAPDEQHEIGSLILAIMLRRDGLRVEYLGPDLPLDDLVEYASYEHPALICLSATLNSSAKVLSQMQARLARLNPPPIFTYGGRAFNQDPALREKVPGHFLGSDLAEGSRGIHRLLNLP
jgi:DNA-binding transcriptional MerR regulator/methylmalonyl-CoA mutase cobalamin-binding subunit